MTTTAVRARTTAPVRTPLTYGRTVDRALVHRAALAEVFLTDAQRVDEHRFLVAAQLPRAHPYYTDHLNGRLDPLLLLECCRQAETLAAHEYLGVPAGTAFLLSAWSLRMDTDPPATGAVPGELSIDVAISEPRWREGRLRALRYRMTPALDGTPLGEVSIRVGYVPADAHAALRTRQRGGAPPSSATVAAQGKDWPAAAYRVGRADPANVVLAGARRSAVGAAATLRVPTGHPSMFDHPLDHVPGMVLTEAARQIALLASDDRRGSLARTRVRALQGTFARYVELDAPVTLTARIPDGDPSAPVVAVRVEQAGATSAELVLELVIDGEG